MIFIHHLELLFLAAALINKVHFLSRRGKLAQKVLIQLSHQLINFGVALPLPYHRQQSLDLVRVQFRVLVSRQVVLQLLVVLLYLLKVPVVFQFLPDVPLKSLLLAYGRVHLKACRHYQFQVV